MAYNTYQEQLSSISYPASSFITTFVPDSGTFLLFINGYFQTINLDYTLVSNNVYTTLFYQASDNIRTAYSYFIADPPPYISTSTQEVLSANSMGPASVFTTSHIPISGSMNVFINGVRQTEYVNYNVVNNTIAFTSLIGLGNIVSVEYSYVDTLPTILPEGIRGSTNLNPYITAYEPLMYRIKRVMGFPIVEIELCDDMIYDNINIAMEWYTKYAGYTEEFLIFSSDLYTEPGLRIDRLFSITPSMRTTLSNGVSVCYDYDLQDYRKVIGVFDVQQGETTGINSLFTLEQAMAQQTYFSYMLGNAGFDLVTWEILKGWLELREKVLAQKIFVDFDNRNQLLRLIPRPTSSSRYYGLVGCYVERPIRQLISERWIFQYATALTKINVGNVRGKYGNVQLFGGGSVNYNDLLSQGLKEKEELEKELMRGYGEVVPCRFFLG